MSAWADRYGPWALITGASDGIGLAMAREAAARGLSVALVARRTSELSEAADAIRRLHRVETRIVPADLGTPAAVADVIARTSALDIGLMAACAGFGTSGPFMDNPLDRELALVDVNCRAVVHLAHAFAHRLAKRRRGGIVLMSSLVSFQGVPRAATYAASKAFVQSFAEALRLELAPCGVDVLASAPGPVISGFGKAADMRITSGASPAVVASESLAALGRAGVVRPGWLSKVLEASLAPLPRRARVRVMQRVMAGMTSRPASPRPS